MLKPVSSSQNKLNRQKQMQIKPLFRAEIITNSECSKFNVLKILLDTAPSRPSTLQGVKEALQVLIQVSLN